ncbi:hypothetical protein EB001_11180 [bacterium]|nr:hypothetical protein [bacterium]
MNEERILEIARKVWSDPETSHSNHMKFANFLIKECISVLNNRYDTFKGSGDEYARGFKSGISAANNTLKGHFGLEK